MQNWQIRRFSPLLLPVLLLLPLNSVATNECNSRTALLFQRIERHQSLDWAPAKPNSRTPKSVTAEVATGASYNRFLENSYEILYFPGDEFGHVGLRIGTKYYSFNGVKDVSRRTYAPRFGRKQESTVFLAEPAKIKKAGKWLEDLAENSTRYNIPPYDVESVLLEVVSDAKGKLRYRSPSTKDYPANLANGGEIQGNVKEIEGKFFLESPTGFLFPLLKKDGKLFAQSHSCSTSTTDVMKQVFGIDLPERLGADDLFQLLKSGEVKDSAKPDFLFTYE